MSFSYHRLLIVFHCRLSVCKSPHVSRTLLSILANFNNVWMVSIFSLVSHSSGLFFRPFRTIPSPSTSIVISVTLLFRVFLVLWKSPRNFLSFRFLLFSLCGPSERQHPIDDVFSCLLILGVVFWLGFGDRLYLKISENFMRLIL